MSETELARAERYSDALAGKTIGEASADTGIKPIATIEPKSKRYTVMVYMIGSNLESQNAAATDDLNEMLKSGIDFANANVIVCAGGARRWNSNVPAGHNNILDLSRPQDDWVVAQTDSRASMGLPDMLTSFVNFCAEQYPAEHNALIFWDHGGGPLWGYGYDELEGGDSLLLTELQQAMEQTPYANGKKKLDWVGFDACLMGSIESAALWKSYTGWLVASEEVEPGSGWDYSFLGGLNESVDPQRIGQLIVEDYGVYYKKAANVFSNPDVTLSLYDLSHADATLNALDGLFSAMREGISNGEYAKINRARRSAKAFGLTAVASRSAGYDLVDVKDVAEKVADLHPQESKALASAVDDLIAARTANVESACGVSLYFPGENVGLYEAFVRSEAEEEDASKRATSTAEGNRGAAEVYSEEYKSFVESYTSKWLAASDVDWTLAEAVSTDEGISLKLTPEQAEAMSFATYTVIEDQGPDWLYNVLTAEVSIEPDEDNVLHVPADPILLGMESDTEEAYAGFFEQTETAEGSSSFVDRNLFLLVAGNFADLDLYSDLRVSATVSVSDDDVDRTVTVESLNTVDEAVGMGGKNTVDASQYSHLVQLNYLGGKVSPTYDQEGRMRPWNEWENGGGYQYRGLPIEGSFKFVAKPASEFGGKYVCQIVVTDVNGERHAIAPADLHTEQAEIQQNVQVERDTNLGKMTFTLFDDHAELSKYEGDDWTLDIPTEIEGLPVTSIGSDAFTRTLYLDELSIPEGITSIGHSAFESSRLFSITLPSTLEHCSKAAFVGMPRLKGFDLRGECKAVSVKDGVLFSKDGKTLLAYPGGKGTSYEVPKGTEVLAYGSFADSGIEEIKLPEGLLKIEPAAFFGCESITSVNLPESLQSIGSAAFGDTDYSYEWASSARATIDRITIGPNVSSIGHRAFYGLQLGAIEVDARNSVYSSKSGVLLNAAGDTLIEAPRGVGNVVETPEGIVAIEEGVFSGYAANSDFILPESLTECTPNCFPYSTQTNEATGEKEHVYSCTIHAAEGSYAYQFAEKYGIPHDSMTDKALLVHEDFTVEQDETSMLFWLYPDHATLVSAKVDGTNAHSLVIPDEVSGKPVTKIDMDIDELSFSTDGNDQVYYIETLVLPSGLESFGSGLLHAFSSLKRVDIADTNKSFKAIDGVLFTYDGEELVVYPREREGAYEVPAGVEVIGDGAFKDAAGLTAVSFPDSLEEVGANAFYSCKDLERVSFGKNLRIVKSEAFASCSKLELDAPLPNSLTRIGERAFQAIGGYEGLGFPEELEWVDVDAFSAEYVFSDAKELEAVATESVLVGPQFTSIGDRAFSGLLIKGFEVDENNEFYRVEGPFLVTKDGFSIVAFADGFEGEAMIPEGVKKVNGWLLRSSFFVSDLYIPESVMEIDGFDPSDTTTALASMRVHVKSGSYAERYALEKGLSWLVEE